MKKIDDVMGDLRSLLACPKIDPLPWKYGQGNIEPRISKEWPINNKTLARTAVNAAPILMDEIGRLRNMLERAQTILNNMAQENEGAIFCRWPISHEPLRADARSLLPEIERVLRGEIKLQEPAVYQ